MKILMVSSYLPYPLFSGGHIRLYNLLKQLSKRHEVTLICEMRDSQKESDIKEVSKFCKKVSTVRRNAQWSAKNIINTGFSFYPFLLVGHKNQAMREKIIDALKSDTFDVIHVETFYVMHNLPPTSLPIVLTEHNIEYLVYERFTKRAPLFIRPLLTIDVLKMKYWETLFWRKVTKLIAVSDDEKSVMKGMDVAVIPNGVDLQQFKFRPTRSHRKSKEKRLLFIGDFKWVQNRDAVLWLLSDIWPKIVKEAGKEEDIKLSLWIVGKNMPQQIREMIHDENVIFDQEASSSTEEIFKQASLLVAPIQVGGGTSFKILEAMATGVPVVTTTLGIEGIKAKNGEEVLIGKDAESIASHVITILQTNTLYERITTQARRLIEEMYNWEKIVRKLEAVYQSAV